MPIRARPPSRAESNDDDTEGWSEVGRDNNYSQPDQPTSSSIVSRSELAQYAPACTGAPRAQYLTRTSAPALNGNAARCWIERELTDASIEKMAASYVKLNAMLDELWLRETLQRVNRELGNVATGNVRRALRSSFAYCARRLPIPYGEKGHVKFPREFAAHLILAELKRQDTR